MKTFVLIMVFQTIFSISAYADYHVKTFGTADITFGYYDKIRDEYTVIKNYKPEATLYWGINPRFITFDDDNDGNYYIGVSHFGIEWGDSNNNFKWVNGKPYCIVKMKESPISKNFTEVTLPVVYYVDNTVIIYDNIDSITRSIDGANAIRIILYKY